MIDDLLKDAKDRMEKSVQKMKDDLAAVRTGRASAALVNNIKADYYGTATPLKNMSTIATPEPRLITIQVWDKTAVPNVTKAIQASDLGINPSSDGNLIRIVVPELSEERRQDISKVVKNKGEEIKIAIRNIRRDVRDEIKLYSKEGEISEDDAKKAEDKLQKLTDEYIETVSGIIDKKTEEIMQV